MKILAERIARHVGQRNIIEQRLSGGGDRGGGQDIGCAVELVWLAGLRVEDLHRASIVVGRLNEISIAFEFRRHRGKRVVRVCASRTVPSAQEKTLVSPPLDILQ